MPVSGCSSDVSGGLLRSHIGRMLTKCPTMVSLASSPAPSNVALQAQHLDDAARLLSVLVIVAVLLAIGLVQAIKLLGKRKASPRCS